jgi:hypothetical protein
MIFTLFLISPILISQTSFSNFSVYNFIKTSATGDNASVNTQIHTVVGNSETKVESNQPGSIHVETVNGTTTVDSSAPVTVYPSQILNPTVIESSPTSDNIQLPMKIENSSEAVFLRIPKIFFETIQNWFQKLFRIPS